MCKMVRMKATRRVLMGRGPWSCLDMFMNYNRDSSHFINEHVNHVVNMFTCLEGEYILQSNQKKQILQMSLTKPKEKVLENIWEFIQ